MFIERYAQKLLFAPAERYVRRFVTLREHRAPLEPWRLLLGLAALCNLRILDLGAFSFLAWWR
jgi:hypothetical protein